MKIYTCKDASGHYLNHIAVIIAANEEHAKSLLSEELRKESLPSDGFTVQRLYYASPGVRVLSNGDY